MRLQDNSLTESGFAPTESTHRPSRCPVAWEKRRHLTGVAPVIQVQGVAMTRPSKIEPPAACDRQIDDRWPWAASHAAPRWLPDRVRADHPLGADNQGRATGRDFGHPQDLVVVRCRRWSKQRISPKQCGDVALGTDLVRHSPVGGVEAGLSPRRDNAIDYTRLADRDRCGRRCQQRSVAEGDHGGCWDQDDHRRAEPRSARRGTKPSRAAHARQWSGCPGGEPCPERWSWWSEAHPHIRGRGTRLN
jgi:hypothetical protein